MKCDVLTHELFSTNCCHIARKGISQQQWISRVRKFYIEKYISFVVHFLYIKDCVEIYIYRKRGEASVSVTSAVS